MRHIYEMCKKYGADFDIVYTEWTNNYNSGFDKSEHQFHRPVLRLDEGKIGGHCVIPNAEMIKDDSLWARYVADVGGLEWKK